MGSEKEEGKTFGDLKKELEQINPKPHTIEELAGSVNQLNESMKSLLRVFEKAEKTMNEDSLTENLNKILHQNREIAKGIIAVADLIKQSGQATVQPMIVKEVKSFDMEPETVGPVGPGQDKPMVGPGTIGPTPVQPAPSAPSAPEKPSTLKATGGEPPPENWDLPPSPDEVPPPPKK